MKPFLKKHDIDGQREAFDVDALKKDYEDAINAWYRTVAQYIFDNFEKYLYFHFTKLKTDAMSLGHPLGNLTHALDKHLFALEEVIIRLEERRNLAIRQEIAFGLKQALNTITPRELRSMFGKYSERSWYRLFAEAKIVKLPNSKSPFEVVRKNLINFVPLILV